MFNQKPYYKEDFEAVLMKPKKDEKNYFGEKCMPVGINDTFMPVKKDDPDNFKMAQYNIKERFGLLSNEDYNNENPEY